MSSLPFPEVIDNTILSQFLSCERKSYWSTHRQLAPARRSVHLVAGGAFAAGMHALRLAIYRDNEPLELAIILAKTAAIEAWGTHEPCWSWDGEAKKPLDYVLSAIDYYCSAWPPETDFIQPYIMNDKHMVEFSFAIPLPINHPVTDQPLIYSGRFDMIGNYNNALFIVDEKTTSTLGYGWSNQWDLRSQFIGYAWGCRHYKYPTVGSIVRGLAIRPLGHDHAQAIIYTPNYLIDRWEENMLTTIQRFKTAWERADWQYSGMFNGGCASYSGCEFKPLCTKSDPEPWIKPDFVPHVWHPLGAPEAVLP